MQIVEHPREPKTRSRRTLAASLIVLAALGGGGATYYWFTRPVVQTARAAPPVPVTIAAAASRNVPIYLDALGITSAANTVTIRSQITGTLQTVNFAEGQEVKQGDTLAVIDPRPLQATLTQAQAKKAQDQALLISAQKDLARFAELAKKDFATQQSLDQQQAKVDQLKATIDADQGAIDNAQTQLSYATIVAPFNGRVGFRQVDAGNIVHPTDANPLTVLAYDQDGAKQLATGELLLIDNQIDQLTSTIRLKARFPNDDSRLWPGEFVRIRAQIDARQHVVTIPP